MMQKKHIFVFTLLLLGVVTGFIREVLIAKYFGATEEAEIFRVAFALPNLLSFTVGGAFVTAMIALLADNKNSYEEIKQTSISAVVVMFLIGFLSSRYQAVIFAPGFSEELLTKLVLQIKICWFMFLLIGLTLPLRAKMNFTGIYWPHASTNFIRAASFVLGLLVLNNFNHSRALDELSLSGIAVFSGFTVLIAHLVAYPKIQKKLKISFKFNVKVLVFLSLSTLYQVLMTSSSFVDRAYASTLDLGSVSAFEYSSAIIVTFAMMVGSTFIILNLPNYARDSTYSAALSITILFLISVCIAAVLLTNSRFIVSIMFARGEFGINAVEMTSQILKWQSIGLPFLVLSTIFSQILLVNKRTSLLISVGVIKLSLKIVTVGVFVNNYGLSGIGMSFACMEIITALMLGLFIKLKKVEKAIL